MTVTIFVVACSARRDRRTSGTAALAAAGISVVLLTASLVRSVPVYYA